MYSGASVELVVGAAVTAGGRAVGLGEQGPPRPEIKVKQTRKSKVRSRDRIVVAMVSWSLGWR